MEKNGVTPSELYKKLGDLQREGEAIRDAKYDGPNQDLYKRAQTDVGNVSKYVDNLAKANSDRVYDAARDGMTNFPQPLSPQENRDLSRGVAAQNLADQQQGRGIQQQQQPANVR